MNAGRRNKVGLRKALRNENLKWKCQTSELLREILEHNNLGTLTKPINLFKGLLVGVVDRARELDDPQLNILMLRLGFYDIEGVEVYNPHEISKAIRQQVRRLYA